MSGPPIVVVGGGLAGLIAARTLGDGLRAAGASREVVVLEAADRVGGVIRSERVDGYLCEHGPETIVAEGPASELAATLGLTLRPTDSAAARRYLLAEGALVALPGRPLDALRTPILSTRGKLRALADLALPSRRAQGDDESVLAFARRRFGSEVAERLFDPIVSGVFAGDGDQLSFAAAFPRLARLERERGSLLRGLAAAARKGARGARGLVGFEGGMEDLPQALARDLRRRGGEGAIRLGVEVVTVEATGNGYRLVLRNGPPLAAHALLLATPPHRAALLVEPIAPEAARLLRAIPSVDVAVVLTGYERTAVPHPLDGFGYLCPRREERRLLGTLFSSAIFSDRAPAGMHLLRALVGGARDPGAASLPDDELVGLVRQELKAALGIAASPFFVRIVRHRPAIPQYTLGHGRRLAALERVLAGRPNLALAGNGYRGVGVQDVVREARVAAEGLLARLAKLQDSSSTGYDRVVNG